SGIAEACSGPGPGLRCGRPGKLPAGLVQVSIVLQPVLPAAAALKMRRPASRSGWRAFGEPFSRKLLHLLEELAAPPRDRTRTAAAAEGCRGVESDGGEAGNHRHRAIEIGRQQVNCDLVS